MLVVVVAVTVHVVLNGPFPPRREGLPRGAKAHSASASGSLPQSQRVGRAGQGAHGHYTVRHLMVMSPQRSTRHRVDARWP